VRAVRTFDTGATRDTAEGKLDFEAFFSVNVMYAFAKYMHEKRIQPDGTMRSGDNWQKGIPLDEYMKSGWRHFFDWWSSHRLEVDNEAAAVIALRELMALSFNVNGYAHELMERYPGLADTAFSVEET
jgi:hypothetical protein